MGLFGSIKTKWKMSEAAVVVEKLLERQVQWGWVELDPLTTANKLVHCVWMENPKLYSGGFGQRPHRLTIAAVALARGIQIIPEGDKVLATYAFALGEVISAYDANGSLYRLSEMDHTLMANAIKVYEIQTKKVENDNSQLLNDINNFKRGTS